MDERKRELEKKIETIERKRKNRWMAVLILAIWGACSWIYAESVDSVADIPEGIVIFVGCFGQILAPIVAIWNAFVGLADSKRINKELESQRGLLNVVNQQIAERDEAEREAKRQREIEQKKSELRVQIASQRQYQMDLLRFLELLGKYGNNISYDEMLRNYTTFRSNLIAKFENINRQAKELNMNERISMQ